MRRGRVGTKRAAIPPLHQAGTQGGQNLPAVPAVSSRRAHRARSRPRPGHFRAVRLRGPRAPGRSTHRRPARRPVRPARPPRAGAAAAGLLDLRRDPRPVPRHRARGRGADRGRGRGNRARGGHRPGRLVGAAPGPAAGRPGARRLPGQRGHLVRRLAGGPGGRPDRLRPGPVGVRAGAGDRRRLPGRPPGTAARRRHQPRRAGQPPVRAGLARPVRAGRAARAKAGPAPARLPLPARVPAGTRGQRAVRSVLPSRWAPASGPDRGGAGLRLRHLPLARVHLRDCRRQRRARPRYRPSAILPDSSHR